MKIPGNFGECIIGDCLDGEGQWELCFTDTLWGKEYDGQHPSGLNRKAFKPWIVNYPDKWDPEFMKKWFLKFQNITQAQVVCTGWKYSNWWVNNFNPIGAHMITYQNGQGMSKTAKHGSTSPYWCFGDAWWKKHKFFRGHTKESFIYGHTETFIPNGFLRKEKYINPSPKEFKTWMPMIRDLNPSSVVDPFAGTCCIGEVCEYLGIPWRGYEIKADYIPDIEKRIQRGMKNHKFHNQESLEHFMGAKKNG